MLEASLRGGPRLELLLLRLWLELLLLGLELLLLRLLEELLLLLRLELLLLLLLKLGPWPLWLGSLIICYGELRLWKIYSHYFNLLEPEPPKKLLKALVSPEKRPPFCWAEASDTASVSVANRRRFLILQQTDS